METTDKVRDLKPLSPPLSGKSFKLPACTCLYLKGLVGWHRPLEGRRGVRARATEIPD
jgi:hypothetical protein